MFESEQFLVTMRLDGSTDLFPVEGRTCRVLGVLGKHACGAKDQVRLNLLTPFD